MLPKLCTQNISPQFFNIPGYSLYSNFDDNIPNGLRGIIIYTKNFLPVEKVVITDESLVEHLWLKVHLSRQI